MEALRLATFEARRSTASLSSWAAGRVGKEAGAPGGISRENEKQLPPSRARGAQRRVPGVAEEDAAGVMMGDAPHIVSVQQAARALPSIGEESHLAGGTAAYFVLGVISNFLRAAFILFHMRKKQIPRLVWSDEFRTGEILLDFMALIIILRTAAGEWWLAQDSSRQGGGAPGRPLRCSTLENTPLPGSAREGEGGSGETGGCAWPVRTRA